MTDTDKGRPEPRGMTARLRGTPLYEGHGEASDLPEQAADTIDAQAATIADLLKALQPFAEASDCLDNPNPDRMEIWEHSAAMCITAGDLRRAKRLVKAARIAALPDERSAG